jgi:hypothetical protein
MPSKTRALTVAQGKDRNRGKQCSHPECYEVRDGVSKWCRYHYRKTRTYGHPDGFHFYKKYYTYERHEASKFLEAHSDHPGVTAALAWINEWMNMTISSDPQEAKTQPPGIDTMARLRASGVTPMGVLVEVAGLWTYSAKYKSKLPDDRRLTVALSRAVYYLAKAHKRQSWTTGELKSQFPNASERDGIGMRIRNTLGVLLNNIVTGIGSQYQAKAEVRATLAEPFVFDPVSLL